MAKITRKNSLMFGQSAGPLELGVFGSLAAGSIDYSSDPDDIQSLSNYLEGWFAAVVGANSPAIEDMNALCYLFSYQLTYLFQAGVAEWNTSAIYYIGSVVNDGLGNQYVSITDTNTGNALTDTTKWKPLVITRLALSITGNTNLSASNAGNVLQLNSTGGAFNLQLAQPSLVKGQFWDLKDIAGLLTTNNVTLVRFAAESIEGLAANFALEANYGTWTLFCDGTNYYFI